MMLREEVSRYGFISELKYENISLEAEIASEVPDVSDLLIPKSEMFTSVENSTKDEVTFTFSSVVHDKRKHVSTAYFITCVIFIAVKVAFYQPKCK